MDSVRATGTSGALKVGRAIGPGGLGVCAAAVLLMGAVLLAWVAFAPSQLGGRLSYVVTTGTSMLPTLEPGGLIVTRREAEYAIGDVVAYKNRQLGKVVLHRIVEHEGDRYILRGDNNDFVDPYRPTFEDIIGAKWLHLPDAGGVLGFLREPINFGLIIGAMAFLSLRAPRRRIRARRHGIAS